MKRNIVAAGMLLFCGLGCGLQAQTSLVNPVPQEITGKGEIFDAPKQWAILSDKARTGGYPAKVFREMTPKQDARATFKVTFGVSGDKAVRKYAKLLPKHSEGYYLRVGKDGIVVAGADERGLYYGLQTLRGMMAEGKLEVCEVKDFPDVVWRGVVEGFYGTPWSHEARKRQLDFYGRNKMNVYIYGPKDDPWHRDKWRVAYPEAEAARISELAAYAHERGVNFYWAIHPGLDIKWTAEDRDALVAKFERMYELGVRSFAVFFDDIWGEGTKADKQAELLNYVDDNFIQKKPDVSPLVMCPTEYNRAWANDEKGYLRTLGTKMNKGIEIMWTGNSVVHCIDKPSMEWINERIDRRAYIWWNFPVSDFVRDHILLGPAYGNGLDIAADVSGFVSNPMEHAEASKIALYGIADYTWNMKAYDYRKDWEKALRDLLPGHSNALRTFALYNKDLGPNGHGFRREEGDELKDVADKAVKGDMQSILQIYAECLKLKTAADILLTDKENPELIREMRPWLLQAKNLADYGTTVGSMAMTANSKQADAHLNFTDLYEQARSLQEQMYELENSDVRHAHQPGIKVGTKVLSPTLNAIFTQTVTDYNEKNGTNLIAAAEYNPYKLTSTVPQLALLPVTVRGNDVSVSPALEVINWPAGGELLIEGDRAITFQGMDFNLGVPDVAKHFRLELLVDGKWKTVSLLHYKADDPVIHTGNELGGMTATALRLTNTSGKELQVYFRHFKFTKR